MKRLLCYNMAILEHLLPNTHKNRELTEDRKSTTVQLNPSSKAQQKCQCAAYSEGVDAGVEVVGEGVCLEKRVVRDCAEWVTFAPQFLLQLQGLLETSLFVRRLSTRVEKCSVSSICGLQTPFLQLENAQISHLNA